MLSHTYTRSHTHTLTQAGTATPRQVHTQNCGLFLPVAFGLADIAAPTTTEG